MAVEVTNMDLLEEGGTSQDFAHVSARFFEWRLGPQRVEHKLPAQLDVIMRRTRAPIVSGARFPSHVAGVGSGVE